MQALFATPRALREEEIEDIIRRFANTARLAQQAGFGGAQIHGAHGYLVSQFLSPLTNLRTDKWGGSPENRMRFVVEIYKAMRASRQVLCTVDQDELGRLPARRLYRGRIDTGGKDSGRSRHGPDRHFGGTYEQPEMSGGNVRTSTREREAYFLKYAEAIRSHIGSTPLMVTGGFRSAQAMQDALASGATDIVGLARPLVTEPDLPKRILAGENANRGRANHHRHRQVDEMAMMEVIGTHARSIAWVPQGAAKQPRGLWSLLAVLGEMVVRGFKTRRLRATG